MARVLLTLIREFFNTFIHSSGDDPLLARAHALLHPEPTESNDVTLCIPIVGGIILDVLVS